MESSLGYLILTCFLIFVMVSAQSLILQNFQASSQSSLRIELRNVALFTQQQMVSAYQACLATNQTVSFSTSMPKSLEGRSYKIRVNGTQIVAETATESFATYLPNLPNVQWVECTYPSGSGRLVIKAAYNSTSGKVMVSLGP
jgi:hypothetical protein